jgi:integrase
MKTFDADLKAAGIAKRGADGRTLVFHSLRYSFCVRAALVLPIQKVKLLMTHRTLAMTADLYADLGLDDAGEDVWALPALLPAPLLAPRTGDEP